MDTRKVWLITGTSEVLGFGECLVRSVLARGDRVIATARALSQIERYLSEPRADNVRLLELDVVSGEETIKGVIARAVEFWGCIDVLVNNAGYGAKGLIEEAGSTELRRQFETNVFGTLDVTNAVLPYMRAKRSGTIVMMGSRTSWRPENPSTGLYASSKAALRSLSETLASEIAPFSIRMLIVEPGAFRTHPLAPKPYFLDNKIADYDADREKYIKWFETIDGLVKGDPVKAMEVLTDVVRGEGKAAGRPWPLYLPLGDVAVHGIGDKCHRMLKVMDDWRDVSTNLDVDES